MLFRAIWYCALSYKCKAEIMNREYLSQSLNFNTGCCVMLKHKLDMDIVLTPTNYDSIFHLVCCVWYICNYTIKARTFIKVYQYTLKADASLSFGALEIWPQFDTKYPQKILNISRKNYYCTVMEEVLIWTFQYS